LHRSDFTEELLMRRFALIDKNVLWDEGAPEGFSGTSSGTNLIPVLNNGINATKRSRDT
jgi:hypothetical protein